MGLACADAAQRQSAAQCTCCSCCCCASSLCSLTASCRRRQQRSSMHRRSAEASRASQQQLRGLQQLGGQQQATQHSGRRQQELAERAGAPAATASPLYLLPGSSPHSCCALPSCSSCSRCPCCLLLSPQGSLSAQCRRRSLPSPAACILAPAVQSATGCEGQAEAASCCYGGHTSMQTRVHVAGIALVGAH